jgi:hypothetical protein
MPKNPAEPWDAARVQEILHKAGFPHLRARKHGSSVIVESGPSSDPIKHFQLRRDTVHLWCLDFAKHTGRWERTPFRDQRDNLVQMIADQFPWTIADRE